MYLLNGNIEYVEKPWPHVIVHNSLPIDVANYMLKSFPSSGTSEKELRQNKFLGCPDDPVFKEFERVNTERQHEFHSTLNSVFNLPNESLVNTRLSFKCSHPEEPYRVLKKWHTDASDKRYKILLYLGSGDGGWLELGNPITKETKKYDYSHNRLVIYNNSAIAFHRYYSSDVKRYTLGFSVKFTDPDKRNYGDEYSHLQMCDEL